METSLDMSASRCVLNTSQDPCVTIEEVKDGQGLISFQLLRIFELVLLVIITGTVCLFGMLSNIINMIVFYKQGLDTTINISFFGLAVSDFLSVTTLEWITICFNPLFMGSGIPWDTRQVMYLTGAWPHLCFGRITCWITTYITAERCLCIALPLRVKQIITPTRTTMIICCLYLVNILSLIPEYSSAYFDWAYSTDRNRTILTLALRNNRAIMEPIGLVLYAVLGTVSFPAVILFTVLLVIRLRHQTSWRQKSTFDTKQAQHTSRHDVKTMNMVVLIAGVLIVCYTPGVLASMTAFFVPSFNIVGANVNLYFVVWSFVSFFEACNSSINIFLYYNMSSKYKQTMKEIGLLSGYCGRTYSPNSTLNTKNECYEEN